MPLANHKTISDLVISSRENVSKVEDEVTMQTLNLVVSLYAENSCVAGRQCYVMEANVQK